MKDNQPLISIITVSFNAVKTIEQTILSVINQTYQNIEYIIIDGGSIDGTLDIIKKYQDKISYWVSEPDKGIYDAMNKGIEKAKGEIIGIINSDDWYELDAVENVVRNYKKGMFIYYGALNVFQDNKKLYVNKAVYNLEDLKKGMVINHPSTFVNKKVYEGLGAFSLKYKIVADWEFILRSYIERISFVRIEEILANFTVGGISTRPSLEHLQEIHAIRREKKLYKVIDMWFLYDLLKNLIFGKDIQKIYALKRKYLK